MKLNYASFMLFYLVHASIQSQRDSNRSYMVVFFNLRNGRSFLNELQEKLNSKSGLKFGWLTAPQKYNAGKIIT